MEEKSETGGVKTPLLGSGGRSRRLSRRNSYNSLRNDFISRLPDKVRAGIDPESPDDIDFSRTSALNRGEKEYYEAQFATLKSFEEVDFAVPADCVDEDDLQEQAQHERAMKISNYTNIILLGLKNKPLTKPLMLSPTMEGVHVPYWDDLSAELIFKNDSSKAGFCYWLPNYRKRRLAEGFCDWKCTILVLNFLFVILLSVNCKSE